MRDPRACYVAGPLTTQPDANRAAFEQAGGMLRSWGWTNVLIPLDHARSNECMMESRQMLEVGADFRTGPIYCALMRDFLDYIVNKASAVALLPGWPTSHSAALERQVALAVGIPAKDWQRLGPPPFEDLQEAGREIEREYARQHSEDPLALEPFSPPEKPSWPASRQPWDV